MDAMEALKQLQEGNQRFVANECRNDAPYSSLVRSAVAEGQKPFAIILGCSDSRVPAEIVFDQGLGDLFVIRVAGNIVAPSQIGSVEFAASSFGTPLVVVLGHSNCGAVLSTLKVLEQGEDDASINIMSIVNRVKPAVQGVMEKGYDYDRQAQIDAAVRANVQASVAQLRNGSDIIKHKIAKGELLIVGAEYSLETGEVDFFDGLYR